MNNPTVIAADIAKSSFQCAQFSNDRLIGKNRSYSRRAFEKLICKDSPIKLVMETCSGAQHWARLAKAHGHEVVLISPKLVSGFRQGQKTDDNDALAIFEASRSIGLKESVQLSAERQGVGVLESVRDHYQTRCTRLGNAMRGHLSEFGIVFPKTIASLKRNMPLMPRCSN